MLIEDNYPQKPLKLSAPLIIIKLRFKKPAIEQYGGWLPIYVIRKKYIRLNLI